MTATPAPALTAAELATVEAFDAAPYPADVAEAAIVETVARAIAQTEYKSVIDEDAFEYAFDEIQRDEFRTYATAAIAAYRAQDDLARRMRALADNLDYYAAKTTGGTYAGGLTDAAGQVRAALATQAGDER